MRLKAMKSLPYRTRQLLADNSYEAGRRDRPQIQPGDIVEVELRRGKIPMGIRVLIKGKKLEEVREPVALAPPPPAVAQKIAAAVPPAPAPTPPPAPAPAPEASVSVGAMTTAQMATAPAPPADLAAARAEYERVSGKKAFNGWDLATLQAKTAAALGPPAQTGVAGSAEGQGIKPAKPAV